MILRALLVATTVFAAVPATARTIPASLVRIVIASPPGGGTDIMARLLSEPLRQDVELWGRVAKAAKVTAESQ